MEERKATKDARVKISSLGRVMRNGKIKECCCDKEGYKKIYVNGKTERVHRLVALAFIPRDDDHLVVNHKNHDVKDNRVENLEWVTPRENTIQAAKQGRLGKNRGQNMPIIGVRVNDQKIFVFNNQYDAARKIGCDNSEINKNLHNKRDTCHGYRFSYYEDFIRDITKPMYFIFE